jgi:hexosaminidase
MSQQPMPIHPCLLPAPRSLELTSGYCQLNSKKKLILLQHDQPQALLFTALRLRDGIKSHTRLDLQIFAGRMSQGDEVAITLTVSSDKRRKPQGYRLLVIPDGIFIEAADQAGIFYGCCTLIQLFQVYVSLPHQRNELPAILLPNMEINDWPDYPNRGVMLDISRDKVPRMETLLDLVDMLASWKINQLQLYTEHTFAYPQHPDVWAKASPFIGEEIMQLDAFCRERFIELVPNQNSFGHLEHWLRLPAYKSLAEAPDGFDFPWGHHDGPFSLCPLDEGSLVLLSGLYDELLPHFTSRQFNVGCDETFDLGQGRSKTMCERSGTGRVYLDFLLKIHEQVSKRGYRMQFWGDIIMAYPDLVAELPEDSIALEWGYEADHPFDEHGEKFSQAGLSFYVCPGTSAWNSIAGRTDNCLGNLACAARNGLKYRAGGYLITDWGDNGHWQTLPISYLGFAAGAAYSWCFQANQDLDIPQVLDRYAFCDPGGAMGKLAYDLGNIYRQVEIESPNASALFHILQSPINEWKEYLNKKTAIEAFHRTMDVIDQVSQGLSQSTSQRMDHQLLMREFRQTIALLKHACMLGLYVYGSGKFKPEYLAKDLDAIIEEYQQVWLLRNRPGGLEDSLSYFKKTRTAYQ